MLDKAFFFYRGNRDMTNPKFLGNEKLLKHKNRGPKQYCKLRESLPLVPALSRKAPMLIAKMSNIYTILVWYGCLKDLIKPKVSSIQQTINHHYIHISSEEHHTHNYGEGGSVLRQ